MGLTIQGHGWPTLNPARAVRRGEGRTTIEIVYWIDGQGETMGEAYFRRDDFCAPIVRGEFAHPYSGLAYKLFVPSRFGKSTDAILDVQTWKNVGRAKPITCPTSEVLS